MNRDEILVILEGYKGVLYMWSDGEPLGFRDSLQQTLTVVVLMTNARQYLWSQLVFSP